MSDFYNNMGRNAGYAEPTVNDRNMNVMVGVKCAFCGCEMSPHDMFCPACGGRNQNYSVQQQNIPDRAPQPYNDAGQPYGGYEEPRAYDAGGYEGYGDMKQRTSGRMDMGFDEMMVAPNEDVSTPSTVNRSRGGAQQQNIPGVPLKRNKWIYFVFTLLLGSFGAHHFYEGKYIRGASWYLPFLAFIPAVIESLMDTGSEFFLGIFVLSIIGQCGRYLLNLVLAIVRLGCTKGDEYEVGKW